ncbi:MAG: hypothetical protein Q4B28_03585 [bacterium]|nr:hypothetical protein [bacterium]
MTTTTFQDYEYHILYSRIYHKYMHRILTQLADRHPEFMHDPELCMDYIEECLGQEIEDRLTTKEWFRRIR